jgi:hypothetical protein
MLKCAGTLIMKKEHMKSIRKRLGSIYDYGWRSTERSIRSQHQSMQESHRSWGVTSTYSVKDINKEAD